MNLRDLENGTEENREVAERLAALPRVEAPANFDFGVKARIAAGGPKRRSALFPFLKVASPLSLVLFVGGFAFFYGTIPDQNVGVVNVEPLQNYAPEPARVVTTGEPTPRNETSRPIVEPKIIEPARDVVAVSTQPRRATGVRRSTNSASAESEGGSFVTSLTDANVIQAPGTDTSKAPEVSIREILEMMGMTVDLVGGKWTVRSTSKNGLAERSGVFVNDIVERINDQPIVGKERFKGKFEGRSVTVGREGKTIKLDLKR